MMNGMSAEDFVQAVQAVVQREKQAGAAAAKTAGRPALDTTAGQGEDIPGRDVSPASFAEVSYSPAPISTYRTLLPDGTYRTINVIAAVVRGWAAGVGSSYAEDNAPISIGTDGFSRQFTGWSSDYIG
jgi:hypothetical protein